MDKEQSTQLKQAGKTLSSSSCYKERFTQNGSARIHSTLGRLFRQLAPADSVNWKTRMRSTPTAGSFNCERQIRLTTAGRIIHSTHVELFIQPTHKASFNPHTRTYAANDIIESETGTRAAYTIAELSEAGTLS